MSPSVTAVRMNDGYKMPLMGFGTFNAKGEEIKQAIRDAVEAGYRHFDCAMLYGNESDIGEAFQELIRNGVVQRKDLFIVSKLWCTYARPELVEPTLRKTLKDLQLDYLDLYLMHWPMAFKENAGDFPVDEDGNVIASDVDFVDTWKAMEECARKGLTHSIGVSNFNSKQLEKLLANCSIVPANNQVESHAYLNQKKLIQFCQEKGILISAYGPLGRPGIATDPNAPIVLDDPILQKLAKKYDRSVAQLLLRYQTSRGIPALPKSARKERIVENFQAMEFDISPEDMDLIDSLDRNCRVCDPSIFRKHPQYPFNIPF